MKEFIEKLIGRLGEQQAEAENEMHRLRYGYYALPCSYDITDIKEIASESFKESIEIVNELAEEYRPKTNADQIRSMSDEELAELFAKLAWNSEVQTTPLKYLDWLQSEAE